MKSTIKKISKYLVPFLAKSGFKKQLPYDRNYLLDILRCTHHKDFKTIIDVGANYGQTSLKYKKLFPSATIYALEPVNYTYSILQKNVKKFNNIFPYNVALSDYQGETSINLSANSTGINTLVNEVSSKFESDQQEKVKVDTLDGFCKYNNINYIDLLKIDTEGLDYDVLKGAEQLLNDHKINYIYTEVGFRHENDKGDFFKITDFLHTKGYMFCGIYDQYRIGPGFIFLKFANALYKRR